MNPKQSITIGTYTADYYSEAKICEEFVKNLHKSESYLLLKNTYIKYLHFRNSLKN